MKTPAIIADVRVRLKANLKKCHTISVEGCPAQIRVEVSRERWLKCTNAGRMIMLTQALNDVRAQILGRNLPDGRKHHGNHHRESWVRRDRRSRAVVRTVS